MPLGRLYRQPHFECKEQEQTLKDLLRQDSALGLLYVRTEHLPTKHSSTEIGPQVILSLCNVLFGHKKEYLNEFEEKKV